MGDYNSVYLGLFFLKNRVSSKSACFSLMWQINSSLPEEN